MLKKVVSKIFRAKNQERSFEERCYLLRVQGPISEKTAADKKSIFSSSSYDISSPLGPTPPSPGLAEEGWGLLIK